MKFLTPAKLMALMMAGLVMVMFLTISKALLAINQTLPDLNLGREGRETRAVPMAVTNLKPGMVVRKDDIGMGSWPVREIRGDMLLSESVIVGRVVREEIEAAQPIYARSLLRLGEFSKEYMGVP